MNVGIADKDQAVESDNQHVGIEITKAEGGALLRMYGCGISKSRVVEGDPESDSFKRKVQRTIVKWTKNVYFKAPPRAKKVETPA